MNFESRFGECCRTCQNDNQAMENQGQGDCKGSFKCAEDQNIWKGAETGKKLKSKVREKDKSGSKAEKQEKLDSGHQCDCLKKAIKKDISDKIRQITKLEKKNDNLFENCNEPWKFPHIKWNDSNKDKCCVSNELEQDDQSNSKMLAETVSELKEKVDFLFRIFKNCEGKLSSTDDDVQSESKTVGAVLKNALDFCNLDRRLCSAEDGIEKLAFILEGLLKESNKKDIFSDGTVDYNDSSNFEELSIAQRINLLKTRNDMLLSFMKGFLKVGSVEKICSLFSVAPEDYESEHMPLSSTSHPNDKDRLTDCSKTKVIETLRNLRMQFSKKSEKQPQNVTEHKSVKNAKKEGNATKYSLKKLEVISEQAELAFNNNNENENSNNFKLQNNENLKGKFSKFCKDLEETDLSLRDVTTRLFAQEAMLKSSLDKVQLELFSKQDSLENNYMKPSLNNINSPGRTDYPTKEKDAKSHKAREINCIYCETGMGEKSKFNDAIFYTIHDDYKEPMKEEKKYVENTSGSTNKQNTFGKNTEEPKEAKTNRKLGHKNSYTLLASSKANRNNHRLSEGCSSSREKSNIEDKAREQRPMTAPNFQNKTLLPSNLKSLTSEKTNKKNLGIKNVKNKNKILLSKKSFVQTS